MIQGLFNFEKRSNAKRDDEGKMIVYFFCEKEGHIIHKCYKIFLYLKNKEDGEKHKKKNTKAIQATSFDDEDYDESEGENVEDTPYVLMALNDDDENVNRNKRILESTIETFNVVDPEVIKLIKLHAMGLEEASIFEQGESSTIHEESSTSQEMDEGTSPTMQVKLHEDNEKVSESSTPPLVEAKEEEQHATYCLDSQNQELEGQLSSPFDPTIAIYLGGE